MQEETEMWIWSLGQEDHLEKEMVTHTSILALGNPMDRGAWGRGLWSLESQRVGHDWATVHVKILPVLQRLSKALADPVHTVWQQCNISSVIVITHSSSVEWSFPCPRWNYFVLWWKPFLLGTIPAKLRVVETVGKKAVSGLLGVTVRGIHSHFCLSVTTRPVCFDDGEC